MIKLILKAYKTFFIIFFLYIKIKNNYYQKHKEELWKGACEKYQNLSEEEKDKRWKKAQERYQKFYWRRKRRKRKKPSVSL